MVGGEFLGRRDGFYWRIGVTVDIVELAGPIGPIGPIEPTGPIDKKRATEPYGPKSSTS